MWYHYDSGYACGAIITDEAGKIIDSAPIFRKMIGKPLTYIKYGKLTKLNEPETRLM